MFQPNNVLAGMTVPSTPPCLHPADTFQRMSLIEEYAILDTPPEAAFDGNGVYVVTDASLNPLFDDNALVHGDFGL